MKTVLKPAGSNQRFAEEITRISTDTDQYKEIAWWIHAGLHKHWTNATDVMYATAASDVANGDGEYVPEEKTLSNKVGVEHALCSYCYQ